MSVFGIGKVGVVWNGDALGVARLFSWGERPRRGLRAYGITIGMVFIGIMVARKEHGR